MIEVMDTVFDVLRNDEYAIVWWGRTREGNVQNNVRMTSFSDMGQISDSATRGSIKYRMRPTS